jgi:YYY domain-containing protein
MPLLLLIVGLLIGFPLLALAGLGLLAFYRALQPAAAPAARFVLLVVALGCAICFGTELIYIRDVFEGSSARMNTIFKFYYQVWLLWGTVSAFAVWWLLARQTAPAQNTQRTGRRVTAYATSAVFLLLLAGGLLYPAINLRDAVQHGTQIGLEGWTPRGSSPAGKAALRWLRENAAPDSVVLEMVDPQGGSYNGAGYAGVAAATGHPTVLGWYGHQIQWRGGDPAAMAELEPRKNDVDQIYRTTNPEVARTLLEQYGVDYVYVGELERRAYPAESLAKFDQIATRVFQQGNVTIYRLPMSRATR